MSDNTPAACFMLAAVGDNPAGPWLYGGDGTPPIITVAARSLPVSAYTTEDPATVLAGGILTLLTLAPRGPVTPLGAGLAACHRGWTVTSRATDLGPVVGPQYAAIRALIADGQRIFDCTGEEAEEMAESYWTADAAACQAESQIGEWNRAMDGACHALERRVLADTIWWQRGTDLTAPLLALAARDLITVDGPFTQARYDLLTSPWVTVTGQPAHPADLIRLPKRGAR